MLITGITEKNRLVYPLKYVELLISKGKIMIVLLFLSLRLSSKNQLPVNRQASCVLGDVVV